MPKLERAAVAATSSWTDPDGFRTPAGEVHDLLHRTIVIVIDGMMGALLSAFMNNIAATFRLPCLLLAACLALWSCDESATSTPARSSSCASTCRTCAWRR